MPKTWDDNIGAIYKVVTTVTRHIPLEAIKQQVIEKMPRQLIIGKLFFWFRVNVLPFAFADKTEYFQSILVNSGIRCILPERALNSESF